MWLNSPASPSCPLNNSPFITSPRPIPQLRLITIALFLSFAAPNLYSANAIRLESFYIYTSNFSLSIRNWGIPLSPDSKKE